MKKIFTLIAVVAFLAACGGNPNKKAATAEEQTAQVEAVVDTCNMDCKGECTEGECAEGEKACCKDEAAKEETKAVSE